MKKSCILTQLAFFMAISFSYAQLTPVTSALVNPAGVDIDDSGNAWLTETGSGSNNGRILLVRPNGDKVPVITGLPSFFDAATNETAGPWRTMQLPNNRLAVILGEGPTIAYGRILLFNMAGFQPGVSAAKTIRDTTSSIDISRFALAQTDVTNSNPFSAVLDNAGNWYVVDAGANMIIKVTATGQRSIFARFPRMANPTPVGPPVIDPVPTKIIARPEGGFYVCTLTGFPFLNGRAAIYTVSSTGLITPYVTGMTLLTDMALDARTGDLYALQFGSFAFAPMPGFQFGSGKVFRIARGTTTAERIDSSFGPGAGLAIDKRGNLFVTSLFTSQLLRRANVTKCFNLDLELTADRDVLTLYSSIKYNLKVTNRGTTAATNVRVFWLPPYKRFEGDPKPFAYQAAYASKGRYDSWNGFWNIPDLAAGESATATFHLFVIDNRADATQIAQIASCNTAITNAAAPQRESDYEVQLVTKAGSGQTNTAFGLGEAISPLGIGGHSELLSINPNPANDKFNVTIAAKTDQEWTLSVRDVVGRMIYQQKGSDMRQLEINTKDMKNGLYLVEYQSLGERKLGKVLVQHP